MPRPAAELEDFSQIVRHSRLALELLIQNRIAPTPSRYAVAYLRQTGETPEISEAIDTLVNRGRFNAATVDEVYDRFFGFSLSQEALLDTSRQIQNSVSKVAGFIGNANDQAHHYETALEDFSAHAKTGDAQELGEAVSEILDETERMTEVNRALEAKLLASSNEIERLRENLERVELEATQDGLTGISNRRRFDSALREAIDTAARDQSPLSLLMVDIDHFKRFNDTYGHQMGDQVLKLVARYMADSIRKEDVAARYGGEEFSIILPAMELGAAIEVGNQIRERVANRKVVNRKTGETMGQITLSLGVAQLRADDSSSSLIDRADDALYHAKSTGRNRVAAEGDLALEA